MREAERVSELRKKVVLSCRILGSRGVSPAAFGHVSARVPGTDRILIKSRGPAESALEFTTARDIITIDLEGKVLERREGLDRPHETAMHLALYRARPEVMSVIHTHPAWVVALTACEKPLLPVFAAYNPPALRLLLDGIPIYPRSVTIVDDDLGREFAEAMGSRKVCFLRGHGMTSAGASVEEATLATLDAFELARLNFLAYSIGEPSAVPEQDLLEYRRRWESGARKRLASHDATSAPEWRHEIRRLGRR
jgi:ribulose-5-phosphate 4-epimerase/fuculose-1-phosphate aldolase